MISSIQSNQSYNTLILRIKQAQIKDIKFPLINKVVISEKFRYNTKGELVREVIYTNIINTIG